MWSLDIKVFHLFLIEKIDKSVIKYFHKIHECLIERRMEELAEQIFNNFQSYECSRFYEGPKFGMFVEISIYSSNYLFRISMKEFIDINKILVINYNLGTIQNEKIK